jgi:TPR repeat protein
MALRFITALVLSIVCPPTPAWADFETGMDAYNRGDYATVLNDLRPLAEQGDANAQNNLGVLYYNGQGVPQDYVQARQWFEKAAAQGEANAQNSLGVLYYNGEGGPQDYTKARQWYEKAAAQGDAYAQFNLGVLYYNGQGVLHDYVQAHMWSNLAAANGHKKAVDLRDRLARKMTPAQIALAQQLAREWKPPRNE